MAAAAFGADHADHCLVRLDEPRASQLHAVHFLDQVVVQRFAGSARSAGFLSSASGFSSGVASDTVTVCSCG